MNLIKFFMLMLLPLTVSAQTLLECHPRDGKFEVQDLVVGNVVIGEQEVILFQLIPVFENITFDAKTAVKENTRTGSWSTYVKEQFQEEVITLQLEDAGKIRRGYLTRESVPFSDDPFFDIIPLKCFEQ